MHNTCARYRFLLPLLSLSQILITTPSDVIRAGFESLAIIEERRIITTKFGENTERSQRRVDVSPHELWNS